MSKYIHPSAVIHEKVIIEDNVYIGPNCIIGYPAEDKSVFPETPFSVHICEGAKITGNVTIDAGTIKNTYIGKNCFLMKGSHVGHDVQMMEDVTLSCHAIIGGHVVIHKGANLGLGSIVHPRQIVQSYTMVGMGAIIPKKLVMEPFGIYVGNPAKKIGVNERGIEKNSLSQADVNLIMQNFQKREA